MRRMLLVALAGVILAGCAVPGATPESSQEAAQEAARNLQSTQPDRSAPKMTTSQAFSR